MKATILLFFFIIVKPKKNIYFFDFLGGQYTNKIIVHCYCVVDKFCKCSPISHHSGDSRLYEKQTTNK